MIALLSNGITSEVLRNALSEYIAPLTSAVIVVTAAKEYKERNYHVPHVTDELKAYGLSVDTFDLDTQDASKLLKYDVVEFIGGNPYYLLNSIRVHNASYIFKALAEKKVLLGWSAGAIVFTPTIEIVDKFTPEMNIIGLDNFDALALTNTHILPHYSKLKKRFTELEEICKAYEQEHNRSIIRLNDGDGIIIDNETNTLIIRT